MPESITITLPRKMPLINRISEASRQIAEWLQTLNVPFKTEKYKLLLVKYELNAREFRYHYSIINHQGLSASDVNALKTE